MTGQLLITCFSMPKNFIMCPSTLILLGINAMYMSTQRWISFPIPQMFRIWGLQCQVIARLMFILRALVNVVKNLTGWILRTFISRDKLTMLTRFKALVLSRLDYGSQLWSPHKICQVNQIEKIQRAFTKHITGMYDLPYTKRLKMLNLNSLHRRRERYCIIYLWKILEGLVPNFSDPIVCSFSDRRGRSCIVSHVNPGRQGTLAFNSFRWRSVRIFNRFPIHICNISACSIDRFKSHLDRYLRTIPDLPSQPGYNNSLDGGDGIQRWTLRDGLAAE